MEDQSYFEFGYGDHDESRDEEREEQEEHLDRVLSRIEDPIVRFCETHPTFHADELRRFVVQESGTAAPGSSDRILRQLRQQGVIDYVVTNRRESLYRVISVNRGRNV